MENNKEIIAKNNGSVNYLQLFISLRLLGSFIGFIVLYLQLYIGIYLFYDIHLFEEYNNPFNAIVDGFYLNRQRDFWDDLIFVALHILPIYAGYLIITKTFQKTMRKSMISKSLHNIGLAQYMFYKETDNKIYFKLLGSNKMDFESFKNRLPDLRQIFNVDKIERKRYSDRMVEITLKGKFPSLEDLKGLNAKDYLQKNKIFIGMGMSDDTMSPYEPKYINIDDLPVGTANLGSAGGGKSNTMNQYLYSIFYNLNRIQNFYMVDFKGGIEAQPIVDLESREQTNKIEIFDDNRLKLYKMLKKLEIINKARMQYLKDNKLKKFTDNYIFIIFDELAEILDCKPTSKVEKMMQDSISAIIEGLLRTGRSQGIKILYSTQSFLNNASGLTSGMKNNTKLKVLHQTQSTQAIRSVISADDLKEDGIDISSYSMGKNLVITETENIEVRSLYISEKFIDDIVIDKEINTKLNDELKPYYKIKIDEMILDDKEKNKEEDTIYSYDEIRRDLGI